MVREKTCILIPVVRQEQDGCNLRSFAGIPGWMKTIGRRWLQRLALQSLL